MYIKLTLSYIYIVNIIYRYIGLLHLSKSFLDPFGNFGSKEQMINTDVFIAESNAGAPRWGAMGVAVPGAER